MQVTIFSFIMAIVWSSFLIMLVCIFRKKYVSIKFFSIWGLLLLYLFSAVRMVLPIEFPYSKIIRSRNIYTIIYRFLNIDIAIGSVHLTMSGVMLCIWIIVSLFMLIKLFYLYHNSLKEIRTFDANPDYVLQDILTQIVSEKRSHVQPSILISSSINTPMSFGIIKKYILLPDRKYKQQESYYILLHEYTHLVSGDLLVKLLISILYCIYWWNPFVYFLKKDLEQPLEIKCDLLIVKDLDNRHKADYLETIIAGIRDVENKKSKQSKHWSMKGSLNLYQKASVDIKERFYIVSKYSKKDSKISSYIIMLSLFFITLSISYMFIVQPVYDVPIEEIETNANTFEIHTDQLVEDENGSFEIILPNGQSIVVDQETALKMQSLD